MPRAAWRLKGYFLRGYSRVLVVTYNPRKHRGRLRTRRKASKAVDQKGLGVESEQRYERNDNNGKKENGPHMNDRMHGQPAWI